MLHTKLHLHYTQVCLGTILKCVIELGNKAYEASITHALVTRQHIRGEGISVKIGGKTPK